MEKPKASATPAAALWASHAAAAAAEAAHISALQKLAKQHHDLLQLLLRFENRRRNRPGVLFWFSLADDAARRTLCFQTHCEQARQSLEEESASSCFPLVVNHDGDPLFSPLSESISSADLPPVIHPTGSSSPSFVDPPVPKSSDAPFPTSPLSLLEHREFYVQRQQSQQKSREKEDSGEGEIAAQQCLALQESHMAYRSQPLLAQLPIHADAAVYGSSPAVTGVRVGVAAMEGLPGEIEVQPGGLSPVIALRVVGLALLLGLGFWTILCLAVALAIVTSGILEPLLLFWERRAWQRRPLDEIVREREATERQEEPSAFELWALERPWLRPIIVQVDWAVRWGYQTLVMPIATLNPRFAPLSRFVVSQSLWPCLDN